MTDPRRQPPIVLKPESGLPGFRRKASLRLESDAIVATDGRGRSRRFPLDGSDRAPARMWGFGLAGGREGLLDKAGNLMAVWDDGIWGGEARADFCIAANIKWGMQDEGSVPPLRPDGIKIVDFPALPLASTFSTIGIVAYAAHQFDFVPDVITLPIMIVALAAALVCLVLWKKASRLDPEVAERRRRVIEEVLASDDDDDDNF